MFQLKDIPAILLQRASCKRKDKQTVVPTIQLMRKYIERSRKEGTLSLEKEIETCEDQFLKCILGMVVDSYDISIISDYGITKLMMSGWKGKKLLHALIVLSGCIFIAEGMHPLISKKLLLSFLGDDEDLFTGGSNKTKNKKSSTMKYQITYNEKPPERVKNQLPDEPLEFNSAHELLNAILPSQKPETQEETKNPFESMPADLSAVALLHLSEEEQEEICKSLSIQTLTAIIQNLCQTYYFDIRPYIDLLQTNLKRTFQFNENDYKPIHGFPLAIKFLRIIDTKSALQILRTLEKCDKAVFKMLVEHLISFEDILQLDNTILQKLVKKFTNKFAMALKGVHPLVLESLLEKLQPNTAQIFRYELEHIEELSSADREALQKDIVRSIIQSCDIDGINFSNRN